MSDKERQIEPCGVSERSQRERVAQRTKLSTADSVLLIPILLSLGFVKPYNFAALTRKYNLPSVPYSENVQLYHLRQSDVPHMYYNSPFL
jgi:hypothetical protein